MNSFGIIGILIYAVTFVIDKMIVNLPYFIYIPILVLALIFLFIGFRRDKKGL